MKETEFRIGNYYYQRGFVFGINPLVPIGTVGDGSIPTPHKLTKHDLFSDDFNPKHWNPIPLTIDWLLELGFTCDDDEHVSYIIKKESIFMVQNIDGNLGHVWDATYTDAPIKYVHQLQSLYFALMGKELVCK